MLSVSETEVSYESGFVVSCHVLCKVLSLKKLKKLCILLEGICVCVCVNCIYL
jgi:hypothetical protein